jgi:hypothetical protein
MRFWFVQVGLALAAVVGFATVGAPACSGSSTSGTGGIGGAGGTGTYTTTDETSCEPGTGETDDCGRTCANCGLCDPDFDDPCDAGPG